MNLRLIDQTAAIFDAAAPLTSQTRPHRSDCWVIVEEEKDEEEHLWYIFLPTGDAILPHSCENAPTFTDSALCVG